MQGDATNTFGVYVAVTYDVISATNSSPQTTEINASVRAETLMKWVHLGLAQAALFAILGATISYKEKSPIWPPILGAGLAGTLLWIQYDYAKRYGLENKGTPTEKFGGYG